MKHSARNTAPLSSDRHTETPLATSNPDRKPLSAQLAAADSVTIYMALIFAALVVVLANPAITGPHRRFTALLHSGGHAALTYLQSLEPQGRFAFLLIVLFCVWLTNTLVFWREVERPAHLTADQQRVLELCQRLADAEVRHDEKTIDKILHDRFVFIAEDGTRLDKDEFLVLTRSLHAKSHLISNEVARIDGTTAFVEGTCEILLRSLHEESMTCRFFTVYTRINGKWKAVEQRIGRTTSCQTAMSTGDRAAA